MNNLLDYISYILTEVKEFSYDGQRATLKTKQGFEVQIGQAARPRIKKQKTKRKVKPLRKLDKKRILAA